jgi:hypothetical protein
MDERLKKALEFSNYSLTIANQKRNIKNRVQQLQIVHHDGGIFRSDQATIAFVKAMIDLGHAEAVIVDTKDNPILVKSTQTLLESLMSSYISSTTEFHMEYEKLKKARNIEKLMDW